METSHPEALESCLLLTNDEIRPDIWPAISEDLSLWRKPACQTLSKALHISSATAWVAPDLLKTLATLSDSAVRTSVVIEKTYNHNGNKKIGHISEWSTSLLFKSFSKIY